MPPPDKLLPDPYKLLGIQPGASEKEIQKAYRKASLKVHPDRNPDDPKAAEKFEQLTNAKDRLLDPKIRHELDQAAKAKEEARARFEKQDGKRRKLQEELERREAEAAANAAYVARTGGAAQERMRKANQERMKAAASDRLRREKDLGQKIEESRFADRKARSLKVKLKGASSFPVEQMRASLKDLEDISVEDGVAICRFTSRETALSGCLVFKKNKDSWKVKASMLLSAEEVSAAASSSAPSRSASSMYGTEDVRDDDSAMDALRRVSFHSRVANSDHKDRSDPPTPSQSSEHGISEQSDSQSDVFSQLKSAAAKQKAGGLHTPPAKNKGSGPSDVINIDTDTSDDVLMRTQSFGRMNTGRSARSRSRSPPFSGSKKSPLAPAGGGGMDLMAKLKAAAAAQAAAKNK